MIKRYKLIFVSALILIAALCFVVAGCQLNENYESFLSKNNLTASVTYILNEGEFNNRSQVKEINYKAGSKPYNMTQSAPISGSSSIAQRNGYTFLGWYEVVLNDDGVPLYEDNTPFDKNAGFEEGKVIQTTETPFDFNKPLEEGQHLFVSGKWQINSRLIVKLITEGYETLVSGDKSYKTGDVIKEEFIPSTGIGNLGSAVFRADGYSFISFYQDETGAFDKRFTSWPIMADEDGGDVVIYAKYFEGDWVVLEDASDISALFNSGGGRRSYYLFNNIDCSSLSARPVTNINNTGFYGQFIGNGFKISNLKIQAQNLRGAMKASLFGDLHDSALIKDVTFENITAEYSVFAGQDVNVFFMFTSKAENAQLENVGFGGRMNVTLSSGANVTETRSDRWLFGGLLRDNLITGVNVLPNTECVIKDSTGAETVYTYNQSNQ